jgi:hypothetical protein
MDCQSKLARWGLSREARSAPRIFEVGFCARHIPDVEEVQRYESISMPRLE